MTASKHANSYNYKDVLKDDICVLMAGMAAEEVSRSFRRTSPASRAVATYVCH
jgi:hypothetical protein